MTKSETGLLELAGRLRTTKLLSQRNQMELQFEAAAAILALLAENERLSKAVIGGVLGDLLDLDETVALVAFVKFLRAHAQGSKP